VVALFYSSTHTTAEKAQEKVMTSQALKANIAQAATTTHILYSIELLQQVQKQNPPTSALWQKASAELAPLFAEMAHRTNAS
jgi:hypothetical protein